VLQLFYPNNNADKESIMSKEKTHVRWDSNHHTCICLSVDNDTVKYIPMTVTSFEVQQMRTSEFDALYSVTPDYPVAKAAALYAGYAAETGGSKEVMQALALLTPLTQGVINMATAKKKAAAESAAKEPKVVKAKAAAVKAEKPAEAGKADKPAKEPKVKAEKAESSAGMFRRLIVENEARTKKWSDDEIFNKVQAAHDVAEDKRAKYVGFYRYDCKRKGLISE
jgi:hypothetical protein